MSRGYQDYEDALESEKNSGDDVDYGRYKEEKYI